jgi:hypothetical protein
MWLDQLLMKREREWLLSGTVQAKDSRITYLKSWKDESKKGLWIKKSSPSENIFKKNDGKIKTSTHIWELEEFITADLHCEKKKIKEHLQAEGKWYQREI